MRVGRGASRVGVARLTSIAKIAAEQVHQGAVADLPNSLECFPLSFSGSLQASPGSPHRHKPLRTIEQTLEEMSRHERSKG